MSERAQALEAALRELTAMVRGECPSLLNEDSGGCARLSIEIDALLAAPPVGVSPQPDTRRDCTCLGTCRGAEGLGPRWKCALEKSASLSPVEPTPDAQVCVWREIETAPKDGTEVLLLGPDGSIDFGHWRADRKYAAGGVWRMRQWLYVFPDAVAWSPTPPVVGTAPQGGEQ